MAKVMEGSDNYSIPEETKLLTALINCMNHEQDCLSEDEGSKKDVIACVDSTSVMMVVAHSTRARRLLSRFVSQNSKTRIPSLDYSISSMEKLDLKQQLQTTISVDYLSKALAIFQVTGEENSVKISIKPDCPIKLKNDDFEIIIAPIVEA